MVMGTIEVIGNKPLPQRDWRQQTMHSCSSSNNTVHRSIEMPMPMQVVQFLSLQMTCHALAGPGCTAGPKHILLK